MILVDAEYVHLLSDYRAANPGVPILVDTDTSIDDGPYAKAVQEGLLYDATHGNKGWSDLEVRASDEEATFALAYTRFVPL